MVRPVPPPPDDDASPLLRRILGAPVKCLDHGLATRGWCGKVMHIVSLRFIRGRSRRRELFHALDEWIDDTSEDQDKK